MVDTPEVDVETKKRHKEIEEGDMRPELAYLDKKFTGQGQAYYAETVEEEIPEQVNWWSKFALCIVRQMDSECGSAETERIRKRS